MIFLAGIVYLNVEKFVAPPVLLPASSSFVLITIGALILTMISLILIVDYSLLSSNKKARKKLISLAIVSKITLTVFIFHNVAYIIPPDSPIVETLILSKMD
ncbi:unnamed protein product [marine sediment metagenome]|uniref:Uncharacterized protein n=1 Tax=marine sediment metagenome TaxID=412755 RepID=X1CXG5_9ZZZZ